MVGFFEQYRQNVSQSAEYRTIDALPEAAPASYAVKPIAFYLPQFHAIAENNAWWGTGFTEWTNVTKALPRYVGHRQPKLPADLGFYDLSKVETLRRQAELARRSGVYGFCIHDYWFSGRKVLETPLNLILANPDIDLRFCLNWANENWSRRWDGSESDLLLEQHYDPQDRDGYARSILPAVRDPRYIRIEGRPLVLVYRPSLLPEPRATFDSWRAFFQREGEGDPFLVMVNSFDDFDPRPYGLDAAAGFPPHNSGIEDRNDRRHLRWFDRSYAGRARSYRSLMEGALRNNPSDYRLLPGVCPSWDNEARKPGKGTSFYNAHPDAFEDWLHQAAERALSAPPAERLVFINAWNEWAEGAILEPDRHFGFANLAAVRHVVDAIASEQGRSSPNHSGPAYLSYANLLRNLPVEVVRRAKQAWAK
ncbi:MAG: glycosyltransferase WbsX family protein [Janthinobacterium lividum]